MSVFQEINRKKANLFWHIIDIVSSRFQVVGTIYQKHIGEHYIEEAKRFNFTNASSILHIGSGAYPITAIILADLFDAHIVTIDKNPVVLKIARKVVKKKGLGNKVDVIDGDGLSFDVSKFDVVIISSCSVPKEKILSHIFSETKNNTIIIVRELPSEMDELKRFVKRFEDVEQIDEIFCCAAPNLCWNSLYFKKNSSKKK